MSDLTILYYTANKVPEKFGNAIIENLLEVAGPHQIVSVSQKPMNLGENICVGEIGVTAWNIYRQMLEGALKATTRYVATAEDDVLYSPQHYHQYRPKYGVFGYNMNVWSIYTWKKHSTFSHKNRRVAHSIIAERETMIEALAERFARAGDPATIDNRYWTEPGKYERFIGLTKWPSEKFTTEIANIAFSHERALGFQHLGKRKKIGHDPVTEINHWGKAEELVKIYRDD